MMRSVHIQQRETKLKGGNHTKLRSKRRDYKTYKWNIRYNGWGGGELSNFPKLCVVVLLHVML